MDMLVTEITQEESKLAKKSFLALQETFENQSIGTKGIISINIGGKEESVTIPHKAFQILEQVLKNMAEGTSFRLLPEEEMIGTQEAAELLKISRPYLVKLLEEGKIPFSKTGTHRRVLRKEILAFDKKRKETIKKNLNFLAKQAQELKLGYE